mmetsp:Transcript_5035/g.5938  ORF Transcript_5035/g.5938 Transcript_5035/m.5938 type:complete len:83 (+) Transcript_5035:497-745(+)
MRINNSDLFDKIKKAEYCFPTPEWDHVSDLAKDLISKLLVTDPDQRLSADDIMEHPWMLESAIQDDDSSDNSDCGDNDEMAD